MAYLPPPLTTPPLDWSFSPPSRQRTLRTVSNQSQRSASGLNIKTDDAQLQSQLQFTARNPAGPGSTITTPVQFLNHPPNTNSGDHPNQYSLNESPRSFQVPAFSSSPAQATPVHPRQPHASSSTHSGSTSGNHHPHLYPNATGANSTPSKARRGILVPAHAYLQKGTKEARAYAQKFGRFDYEGDVKVGAGAGGANGTASNATGWAIWVVDKWVTDSSRPLKTIIVPTTAAAATNQAVIGSPPQPSHVSPRRSSSPTEKPSANSTSTSPTLTKGNLNSQSQAGTITLHLLTPQANLSDVQATREIEAAVRLLRRGREGNGGGAELAGSGGMGWEDRGRLGLGGVGQGSVGVGMGMGAGGRGIETEWGVMVVTSLSNLRQDVQPILVPSGDLRPALPLIEVLLNLRRLGSSSRQSLTLEPPSKATQYKFFSLYRFQHSNEGGPGKFERTIEELVRVLKIALAFWGLSENEEDEEGAEVAGLCTDKMMERIGKWRKIVKGLKQEELSAALGSGTQESMEEILAAHGPSIVASLLSSITSVRVKLAALDLERVPRDPFTKRRDFQAAIIFFQRTYMHRTTPVLDHLDVEIYTAISEAYNKEKHHDHTRITRILKNQVTQAGSNIVSNLNIGLRRERDRDSDDETYDTADDGIETTTGGGTLSAPENMTGNLDCFARLVITGKSGVGYGRLRALWTDKIAEHPRDGRRHHHHLRHREPHSHHDFAFDKSDQRETAGEGDLDTVEETLSPEKRDGRRHLRHKSLSTRKGTLRNMTSKTGHALKDWASRRGTLFGDSGDEQMASAPPSVADFRPTPSRNPSLPVVVLPERDETDFNQHANMRSHTLAHSDLYSSHGSHRTASETSRPSIVTNLSFVESDTFDEAGPEFSGHRGYDPNPSNRTSIAADATSIQKKKTRLLGRPRRPLERMVTTGSSRKAIAAGAEWIHWGHLDAVYEEELARQVRERGLRRRWSFESSRVPGQVLPAHHRYLNVDVQLCARVWIMRQRERELRDKVEAYAALEDAVWKTSKIIVREIKIRRAKVEALQEAAHGLVTEPAPGSAHLTNRTDSDSIKEHSRLLASRRLAKQLALKNDKLSYSSRELDKNVSAVETAKRVLDSFAHQYTDPARKSESIDGEETETTPPSEPTWTNWFRRLWPV